MPHNGLHGLVGLVLAKRLARKLELSAAQPLVLGIVLGLMLPDADIYPGAILWLGNIVDAPSATHRLATHSFFFVAILFLLGAVFRAKPIWSRALVGFAVGVVGHIVLDLFMWFEGIHLLWPMSVMSANEVGYINLWDGVAVPEMLKTYREVAELLFAALYLHVLVKISDEDPSTKPARKLRGCIIACWVIFVVAGVAAPFIEHKWMILVSGVPMLLFALPVIWWQTYRLRDSITKWCLR